MSTITNEPILLDSTGQDILTELKNQNGYLAMIAGGGREAVYGSMREIAAVVRGNDVEHNKKLFPIGDQIIMPWKDMDDSAHNTDETAYQVAWDIVHHELVTLRDGSVVPGMFLQMHKASAYGVQFSAPQAVYHCDEALPAGKYCFGLNAAYGDSSAGSMLEFTLTQAVPADGRIRVSASREVTTYAADATDPIETTTASAVASSSGTNLGTTGSNGLNSIQRMQYGSNRWSTSAIRQYLNKSGTNWWTSQEDFDIRPDQHDKKGFMTGFDDDFLSAIKPIKVTTALNTVEDYKSATEDTYDAFFLPSLQQMNIQPQLSGAEGSYFEYWRTRMGGSTYVGTGANYIFDAFKIPALNANSAQNVHLRSVLLAQANAVWHVFSAGYISTYNGGYGASVAFKFSPVCVVC